MSRGHRRRTRVDVGSRVMICADIIPHILEDMALVGLDGNILKDVWMFGTVKSRTVNYFEVELPAAEETISFAKEKVKCAAETENVPIMYVVMGCKVEALHGLRLPPGFIPKDYYYSFDEAKAAVQKSLKKGPVLSVQKPAETPGIIAPVFNSTS